MSPALFLILIPLGIRLGRPGTVPIKFGNAEELKKLHATMPGMLRLESLALAAPVTSLGVGYGWYLLVGTVASYGAMGVVLWHLGMIFVVTNDTLELGWVATLPAHYQYADNTLKPALLGFGRIVGYCIELFSLVGGLVSFSGIALISASMLHTPGLPIWLGALGIIASALILVSRIGTYSIDTLKPLGVLGLVGFILFMTWIACTGAFMLRS